MEPQQLQTEYTDIKSVTHRVEHATLSPTHAADREKLLEELAWALKRGKVPGYTVMSNHHLRDKSLSLKAKGLLSLKLSLPEEWDYPENRSGRR